VKMKKREGDLCEKGKRKSNTDTALLSFERKNRGNARGKRRTTVF